MPQRVDGDDRGRIETREQGVKARELEQLLDLYQVSDSSTRAWLLGLAATAHERGYWRAIRKDLPEDFHGFVTLPEPIPDFGYTEGPGEAIYIEDREMVRTLLVRWGILTERALSSAESVEMITEAAKAYQ